MASSIRKIARNWRVKLFSQKVISLVPGKVGFKLNELFTRVVRGNIDQRVDPSQRIRKCLENISFIRRYVSDFTVNGSSIIEVGTGWHGIDPLVFYVLGSESVTTLDQHRHLTLENIKFSARHFDIQILQSEGVSVTEEMINRVSKMKDLAESAGELDGFLEALSIRYVIVNSRSYRTIPKPRQPFDLFYSESVLQRIPIPDLRTLFSVASEFSTAESVTFHRTDQKDINAQQHVDRGLWSLHYLKYEDWFYSMISSRFNSQNRLRESDFVSMLSEAGWNCIAVEGGHKRSDLDRIKSFEVATRFIDKDPVDLATIYSKILSQKGWQGNPEFPRVTVDE